MAAQAEGSNAGSGGSVGDRAKAAADQLKDEIQARSNEALKRSSEALRATRGKAGDLQATLADRLDVGAEAIRERVGEGEAAGPRARVPRRVASTGVAVADTLEGSATWLRENELADLGTMLGRQLREHPGRTALLALGIGILLGRATRR